jgi:superfamily II DNA or RNA helicase
MICTIKSVHRIRNLSEIKILLIDEVHRASSKTFQDFLKKFSPPIKLGFSATPEGNTKYNFALIRQFFGTIIYSINAKYLIKENKIAKPVIYFVNNISSPEINWPITEQKQIIYNKDRNNLIADFVNKNNDKCFLILVSRIEHGKILKEKIPNSVYLDGSDSVKHRDEIKNKMENGEVKVTITTNIFNEGISIKAIQVLINASARKSSIQTIQKLGRALRIKDNKKKSLVIDFQDNGNKFLYNQYEKRKNIWIKEGFDDINEVYDIDLLELDIETTLK